MGGHTYSAVSHIPRPVKILPGVPYTGTRFRPQQSSTERDSPAQNLRLGAARTVMPVGGRWRPRSAGRRAFSRIVPVTQRHTVERHHLEANRAVGSFQTGLAARRGRILANMTIQRMDNVAIVVDDLDAAVAFFTELGMELEGKGQIEGLWADRTVGLDGVRSDIAMMRTPDGHSKLELTKYHAPAADGAEPENPPPNTLGLHRVMFAVDDIHDTVARLRAHGAELLGEVAQYESIFLLCYLRGPAGIIVALAEQIG